MILTNEKDDKNNKNNDGEKYNMAIYYSSKICFSIYFKATFQKHTALI